MKKGSIIIGIILIFIIVAIGIFYFKFYTQCYYISDNFAEDINIILPKSEVFKVTSTAKGDNQSKLARIGDMVYTFYLDNSGCTNPSAPGNDKVMRLLSIDSEGNVSEFDSIPVWMHGNILADTTRKLIYVTTYEEESLGGSYYPSVKVYTYSIGEEITRTSIVTLVDEKLIPYEANPRVGADIDQDGNIAVAFSNYIGIMFVYVYNVSNDTWQKHSIEYYHDTYINDCVLYPYVRIKGVDCIKVIAGRDSTTTETGEINDTPSRDYSRYFSYNGEDWTHFIIGDLRGKYDKQVNSAPLDLYIDSDNNAHVITQEYNQLKYYIISPQNLIEEQSFINLRNGMEVIFVRIANVFDNKYFVISGMGIKGFKQTGYLEIYDINYNLIYRNNSICNSPYVYINKLSNPNYLDIMVISRDSDYAENSDTSYICITMK